MALSDAKIRTAKPAEKPYKMYDSGALSFRQSRTGRQEPEMGVGGNRKAIMPAASRHCGPPRQAKAGQMVQKFRQRGGYPRRLKHGKSVFMSIDTDYNNVDFIPGGSDYPDRWVEQAQAFRETEAALGRARLNVSYGDGDRQKLDIFHPSGQAHGLAVFVHGGYWLRFDRSFWSHFSTGLTQAGWAVAMPSYTLAPDARIAEMTREIARAIETAADLIPGPIRLTGHSAGGHLVSRMGCSDVQLSDDVRARLKRIVPISPVSDLKPLMLTLMNDTLRLDDAEATTESPINHSSPESPVTVWVGADERPVFLDQARWLSEAWGADLHLDPNRHHFDVIDGLKDAHSPLTRAILN